jgi:peptide/nickel transport system ATP-binding protein
MLTVKDLSIRFTRYDNSSMSRLFLDPVKNLNLDVRAGELVAVIGASGSGKSLLAHAILGILPQNCRMAGELLFEGKPLTPRRQKALRGKRIVLVPQSVGFLNPLKKLGSQVQRAAVLSGLPLEKARAATDGAFERYRLIPKVKTLFPFQVSGGMARRVLTATATVGNADLIIADEPTTGLHKEAAAESVAYLRVLADEGKSVIVISHDLNAVLPSADRVAVFYAGTTVEQTDASNFSDSLEGLRHPYSKAMWRALPDHDFFDGLRENPQRFRAGCPYAQACDRVGPRCEVKTPHLHRHESGFVRCHCA